MRLWTGLTPCVSYYPHRSKSDITSSRLQSPSPIDEAAQPAPEPSTPTEESAPQVSHDKALNAFAQLGALRLNARRCLISFFDRKNCYMLAEATRTLCLHTGQAEFKEDSLCWGSAIFPKEMSLCYYTVNLRWENSSLPLSAFANHPSLVVNDLTKDPRFKDYPFVVGPPYSKFYAGVPIRSPSGHSIGTYCVLDDHPRDGIKPADLDFLKDMAGTVMRHLEMFRATEDQRRGKIMVRSLGSFAEGKSGLENWWVDPWEMVGEQPTPGAVPDMSSSQRQRPTLAPSHGSAQFAVDREDGSGSNVPNTTTPDSNSTPASSVQPPGIATTTIVEAVSQSRPEVATKSSTTSSFQDQTNKVAPEIKAAFSRASNMIVDATEAEGVVFFDAKISTFGGLVDDDFFSDQLPEPDKPCAVLGTALSKVHRDSEVPSGPESPMSESVLRHLLRLYPHGEIFNLDDPVSSPAPNSPSGGGEVEMSDGFPFTVSRKSDSLRSMDDENYLRTVFPKARSLVLYPLWDPHRDRWFASAFIWSSDPLRIFTNEQDLAYLAAFSNSAMAEVARLDMKLADSAKADFISSISHELRSPLHGILGMTDLLKDSEVDAQQASHVATIETCGKTLLETINHVSASILTIM
jgi:hypothetical protein